MDSINYTALSDTFAIEPELLRAVVLVEAGKSGFFIDWNGDKRIKIQFEPHIFVRVLKRRGVKARLFRAGRFRSVYVDGKFILMNKVDRQKKEWDAFNKAWKVDKEVTMLSTSYGLGQIMGFNYKLAGYDTVGQMLDHFKESEHNQIQGMIAFMQNRKVRGVSLLQMLKNKDFQSFARYYNGPGYKKYNYDTRIENAYKKFKMLPN